LKPLFAYILVALYALPIAAQEAEEEAKALGYEVLANRVLIETPDDWRVWDAPTGARIIQEDGTVIPRLLRSGINAVFSAEGDSVVASATTNSNFESAQFALDGDDRTFWEPDPADDLSKWTFELDLNRTLIVERVVVRFVGEGEGDPFRQFRVLVSDGLVASGRAGEIFSRIGLVRNLSGGREFSFDLTPQRKVAEGIEGAIVQKVRIDVLATEGARAEEISQLQYESLSEEDRGEIDYFLQTSIGRLIAVSKNTYDDLPGQEKGPVRHYRRERPRLAEVEVFALGENIVSITQAEQRIERLKIGRYEFLLFQTFTDGLFSTNKDMLFYDAVQDKNQVEIDLGAKYWLDRVKLLSPDRPPFAYQFRISNGAVDANGNFVWTTFDERRNLERFLHVEERFPRQEVRYIEFRQLEFSGSRFEKGRLSEIQAYGEGFVSEITMESPFIQLDRPRLFDRVTWDGEAPPSTRIEVRTRTGEEVTLEPHYFTQNGREISEDLWRRLPDTEQTPRPAPVFEEITGPDWSNWSPPYTQSDEAFKSPAPRPLVKVQVRLLSREPLQRAWLRSLRLHFVPPLVDTVFGEIFPVSGVEPGVEEDFTLYIKPIFGPGNPGFDQVVLRSTSSAALELLEVLVGDNDALRFGAGTQLWPSGDVEVTSGEEGAVVITFPTAVTSSNQVYAFRFRTKVFLQSTVFSARLQSASRPGLSQEIVGGDATNIVATQSLAVVSRLENSSLLEKVEIAPNIITPNGDGINDQVQIQVSIFHLERPKTLAVEVFDLAGRRVRNLSVRRSFPSGEHLFNWDGRSDGGIVLPPGTYALRVHFNTDSGASGTSATRLVHLVY